MYVSTPQRIRRSYTQHLAGSCADVFPLLCPVREVDWIDGWDPTEVYSESGIAEPECVFLTRAAGAESIWVITRHEPAAGIVEMIKVTPQSTVCHIAITLAATATGCAAAITYSHTRIGAHGDEVLRTFTDTHFEGFMQTWETRLNHYLRTGTRLPA